VTSVMFHLAVVRLHVSLRADPEGSLLRVHRAARRREVGGSVVVLGRAGSAAGTAEGQSYQCAATLLESRYRQYVWELRLRPHHD
jgi:hypothetical protein